ncbi:MAG: hypothetical protein Q7R78_02880 [bacterium]|nr:hypothetical protein [bacterium]
MNDKPITLTEFLRKLPPITLVGVMGVCGKSTTLSALVQIFKNAKDTVGGKFMVVDLSREDLFESYLKDIRRDNIIITKIDAEYMEELDKSGIIPHISVFTNIVDIKPYKNLLKNLTYTNYVIGTDDAIDQIKKEIKESIHGKMIRTGVGILPKGLKLSDLSYHFREDISLAVRVAEIFEIPHQTIINTLSDFKGLPGRLEYIKKIKEVSYVNDAHSECFMALSVALPYVSNYKNAVLIFGGNENDYDSEIQIEKLVQYCHTFVVIPGSGSQKIYKNILNRDDIVSIYAEDVKDAVAKAHDRAGKGDVVIFSPGFCTNRVCGNRDERSEKFLEALRKL